MPYGIVLPFLKLLNKSTGYFVASILLSSYAVTKNDLMHIVMAATNLPYRTKQSQLDTEIQSAISISFGAIPRYMEDGNIKLRPLRIADCPLIGNRLRNRDNFTANGLSGPILQSWFSVWWWLKRRYALLRCIEINSECIGFIGLYNLNTDKSAEMTLVIFDDKNRRAGYGTKAFNLFAQVIKKYFLKIIVRVRTDNYASIAFWSKLGFEERSGLNGIKVMSMDLKSDG